MRLGSSSRDGGGADLRGDDRDSALAPVRAGRMLAENSFDSVGHLLESFSEARADGFGTITWCTASPRVLLREGDRTRAEHEVRETWRSEELSPKVEAETLAA